ncbi:AsmA-like C-terminal region-containing protein [Actomonas aquatica]|uniref:AsmA-like C-terminal region-containing protein n=1 Tax=Actomonas aquatica TaxID=2866162 RepID=A0ABZ1C5S2_9BACT|nr:AsmA-like C-terminal region-containing protein [Opitutus sp. WL0086]WRQ87087.1 AsmA-like C-terminal region-containing protein [Opitutus sp. WL0086]
MPPPRWLKLCREGSRWCGHGTLTAALWSLWLLLGIGLGIQCFILSSRELTVPRFLLREIETRLAASGLEVSFGGATFDPGGHVLLREARVNLSALDETILEADAIYLELNPLTLWFRHVDLQRLRIDGADLLIPAALSPSGTRAPLVQDLNLTLRPGDEPRLWHLDQLTAHAGPLPLDLSGAFYLPPSQGLPVDQLISTITRHYLDTCRLAARYLPQLPPHQRPHLSLHFKPDPERLAFVTAQFRFDQLELPAGPAAPTPIQLHGLTATTTFDFDPAARLRTIDLTVNSIQLPHEVTVQGVRSSLESMVALAPLRFEPRLLDLSAATVSSSQLQLSGTSVRAGVATLPQVQALLHTQLAGHPLEATIDLDVTTRAGRIRFATALDASLLEIAGHQLNFDVPALLSWAEPPELSVDLNLAAGGRPLQATASFRTGPVTARRVDLDATAARVTWSGTSLRADEILLLRGASRATGSYEMDTKSLDFRFLLQGRLEPADINGWFRDWWPNLWSNFQFPVAPPDANVEVSGRWKKPLLTRVWVQARGDDAVVKDIALDHMNTRLFVRPGWADVLDFHAIRPVGEVRGSFSRAWKLPRGTRWTRFEVHAEGTSDLDPLPKLLGDLGTAIAEPFSLEDTVDVRLDALISRDDWGTTPTVDVTVDGHTSGAWTFFDFPLQGAEFSAHQTDERLLIDPFSAGATGGALNGRIEVARDPTDDSRQIAFDLNLSHAHLGQTIRAVETWSARRRGEEPKPESDFQQRIAEGALNLSLSAVGPAGDPYAYQGQGAVTIEEGNLGELKLLGPLSTLLGSSLLNFSKLQLDNAYGDFLVDGRVVDFDAIKLTGARGAIDGDGKYYLDTRNLDFLTRVRPFEGGRGRILDTVFTPLTHALEVKLGGKLNEPAWTFVYGPTNFLRALTGSGPTAAEPSPAQSSPPTETATPPQVESPVESPDPSPDS